MSTATTIRPHIRWMIRRDLAEVTAIEAMQFGHPWTEDDFLRVLRQRNCIGMVSELGREGDPRMVGYMLYELHADRLFLLNFAVAPDVVRQGVGRRMVDKLKGKLSPECRKRIVCEVRETNVAAQLFFRAMGFRCRRTLHGHYSKSDEDAYEMTYRCTTAQTDSNPK